MSKKPSKLEKKCCFCSKDIPFKEVFSVSFDGITKGSLVVLSWHIDPCLVDDPLHEELADLLSKPDTRDTDMPIFEVYKRIHKRIRAEFGAAALQDCIFIPRDTTLGRPKLRNKGLLWGVPV